VIWFFYQGRAQIDLEVCRATPSATYQLVVTYPDGSEQLEQFPDPRALVRRVIEVEDRLVASGWRPGWLASDAMLGPVGEPPAVEAGSLRRRVRRSVAAPPGGRRRRLAR
jgi:hypothetical protein